MCIWVCVFFHFFSALSLLLLFYISIIFSPSVFLCVFFFLIAFLVCASHVMHIVVPRADSRNTERILSLFDDDFHCFFCVSLEVEMFLFLLEMAYVYTHTWIWCENCWAAHSWNKTLSTNIRNVCSFWYSACHIQPYRPHIPLKNFKIDKTKKIIVFFCPSWEKHWAYKRYVSPSNGIPITKVWLFSVWHSVTSQQGFVFFSYQGY